MLGMDRIYRISQFGVPIARHGSQRHVPGPRDCDREAVPHRDRRTAVPGRGRPPQGLTVVCCRVSSRGQRDDLKRPVSAMEAYGPGAGMAVDEWRSEIGAAWIASARCSCR